MNNILVNLFKYNKEKFYSIDHIPHKQKSLYSFFNFDFHYSIFNQLIFIKII